MVLAWTLGPSGAKSQEPDDFPGLESCVSESGCSTQERKRTWCGKSGEEVKGVNMLKGKKKKSLKDVSKRKEIDLRNKKSKEWENAEVEKTD